VSGLHAAALGVLRERAIAAKLKRTAELSAAWRAGGMDPDPGDAPPVVDLPVPGRPDRPVLVPAREVPSRPLGSVEGRAALVHAVAHIEFNAINLAWDAVYRFRGLPRAFYDDWVGVADDEARHFAMLQGRLGELGLAYGDLPAHDGLWQSAVATAHDPLERMALVPRVLEARGLDVTPGMIARLRSVGDARTAGLLETILREEVAHVAAGSRWFRHLCERAGRDPEASFLDLVGRGSRGSLRGPHNLAARAAAGFSERELQGLARLGAADGPDPPGR
jgi:uncharacterized ferritin-like protein (DUF455 family)